MLEMHVRQPGFTYSACGPCTKKIQKFKGTRDSRYIYQNDIVFNITRRTASDKILCDKAFDIAKYPKYDGYQRGLASMVYTVFDKKNSGSGIINENISNKELAEELDKSIIRKF